MSALDADGHLGDAASALLDGELAASDAGLARRHLASCPSCTAALARLAVTRDLLRSLPAEHGPVGLGPQIVARRHALLRRGALAATTGTLALVVGVMASAPTAAKVQPKVGAMVQLHLGEQVGAPALVSSIAAPKQPRPTAHHVQVGGGVVTVFSESGDLDRAALVDEREVEVGDRTALVAGEDPAVVVVETNSSVLTAVGGDVRAAVAALEQLIGGGRSIAERAHDACQDLVDAFGLSP